MLTKIQERANENAQSRMATRWHHSTGRDTLDDSLIERIAAGDKLAMEVLFARHKVRVYRFALRLVQSESLAEDLVSEVFFEVWKKARLFEGRSQVSTWILAIARHKALKTRRRLSTEAWDDDACESIADTSDDPETAMQKKQKGAILVDCLANLSVLHREIVDLVYYHEKSIDEVAKIIQVPRNTVKTRMFYARRQLAGLLAAKGVEAA